MTLQIVKTKAETAWAAAYAAALARLPGNGAIAKLRRDAIARFEAVGLPNRRVEEWKYTDLRTMLKEGAPLATGGYWGETHKFVEYSCWDSLKGDDDKGDWILFGDGAKVTANGKLAAPSNSLANVLAEPPAWVESELKAARVVADTGVMALNSALMTDGGVIDIPAGTMVEAPMYLVFNAGRAKGEETSELRSVVTRNLIRVGKGAKLTLVESYCGSRVAPRQRNSVTQLILEAGAELNHIYQAETDDGSLHLGHVIVTMAENVTYRPFFLTRGDGITRNDVNAVFKGQRSTFDLGGLTLGTATSHADTTLVVDHAVPHCTSRELYHSVLAGESKSVFQGKVIVRPGAQKSDGKQMARALMLSPNAEFDSKPELEIYADDVVCGHGSTSVEIDADMLFYCRSRGIPLAEARALLVESFAGEATAKIEDEALRTRVLDKARAWLSMSGV